MRMEKKFVRRRRIVFAIACFFAGALAYLLYQIIGHVWWVGDHYCWGEMTECFFPNK